ncbi:unnamed protein product [Alternaria alternata]
MYINRRELGNTTSEKPLNAQQTGKTMVKYSNVWLEIIAYIWRTHELPVVTPSNSEEEVEGKRPLYCISAKQHMCIEKIKRIVGQDKEEDWFDEMATDEDNSDDNDDDDDDDRLDEEQEEVLEGYVLLFMLSLLDYVLGDNEYTSALISSMAVLGISAESGWLDPIVYTPKQLAVVTTSPIDWERLVDNGAETKVGWSFMEDPRNKHATSVEELKQWLGQRLQDERKLREEFVDVEATRSALARGAGVVWAKDRVRAYGQAMKEARRKLAALVHMTGGAPPRGTELVSIKYRNSANGDSCGIFIEDGAVVFVTKYHKNVGQTGKGKVIYRYMPREDAWEESGDDSERPAEQEREVEYWNSNRVKQAI